MDNSFHRTVGKCDEHNLIALMQEEYASFKELRNCKCLKQKTLYFTLFMLILGYTSIKFHVTGGDSGFLHGIHILFFTVWHHLWA